MSSVLPSRAAWLRDRVTKFEPDRNTVITASGDQVEYKQLIIAIGLELRYDGVKGLSEALLEDHQVIYIFQLINACDSFNLVGFPMFTLNTVYYLRKHFTSQVCSNYSPLYVKKTFPAIQTLSKTGGNAIFTFPKPPIKCPGAPQKIAYITDNYLRKVCNPSAYCFQFQIHY